MNQPDGNSARDAQEARESERDEFNWIDLCSGDVAPMTPAEEAWLWTLLGCDVAAKREAREGIDDRPYCSCGERFRCPQDWVNCPENQARRS